MSAGKAAALDLAESSRDPLDERGSFASNLFIGRYDFDRIFPFPAQSAEDRAKGDPFLKELREYLEANVDADEIDRTGEIPQKNIDDLFAMGAFGIKIPTAVRRARIVADELRAGRDVARQLGREPYRARLGASIDRCSAAAAHFRHGRAEERSICRGLRGRRFRLSPSPRRMPVPIPANMSLRADPTEDGSAFILNGEKLWCTNLIKAGVLVVMAKTPPKMVKGRERKQITAFIVDVDSPGLEITYRCHFMGLRALYNGIVKFTNVRVPRENMIAKEGQGLKVALTTLNTGRLTIPAACVGLSKRLLEICRKWASERVQWGVPIGQHYAIAGKIAEMAGNVFAMEAMTFLTSALVDRKAGDLRIETAMCKMWATEATWRIADEAMQVRGGRGYETVQSLEGRGEEGIPVERFLRDCRINMIFEGSSEIMRLFIAREALDPHLKIGGAIFNTQLPTSERARAVFKSGKFYASWYPKQWMGASAGDLEKLHADLRPHVRYAAGASKRLARGLFHAMTRFGPKLDREQLLLARFVGIATELFAMSATCAFAQHKIESGEPAAEILSVATYFCRSARMRIDTQFAGVSLNADRAGYDLTQELLAGKHADLRKGIVDRHPRKPRIPVCNP